MIDHLTLTVPDVARTRAFYESALAPLGYTVQMEWEGYVGLGSRGKPAFWIKSGPLPQSPMHIAFAASTREAVDAFHRAALAAGGRDDGPPGVRSHYHASYYGAFVLDLDGHPVEAVCHTPPGAPTARTKTKPEPKAKAKPKLTAKAKPKAKARAKPRVKVRPKTKTSPRKRKRTR